MGSEVTVAVAAAAGAAVGLICTHSVIGSVITSVPASDERQKSVRSATYAYTCEPYTGGIVPTNSNTKASGQFEKQSRVVHFIRHAQGTHNIAVATEGEAAYANWKYRDSRLTDVGKKQCLEAVPIASKLDFDTVLVSPLSRTLQTAETVLPQMAGKMVACELVRERVGLNPCDLRREKNELSREFPGVNFDSLASECDHQWSIKREPLEQLQARADDFLAYIFESDYCQCPNIGVVTHNDFLTMLLYDSSLAMGPGMPENKKFKNCDIKSYLITRTRLRPNLREDMLSEDQKARYPKSTGNKPVVQ